METLPPPPLFSGYSSGIFNYSLGEMVEEREGRKGKKITRRGPRLGRLRSEERARSSVFTSYF